MIKDKKFLEKIASNCIDKARKLGATDCEVTLSNIFLRLLTLEIKI